MSGKFSAMYFLISWRLSVLFPFIKFFLLPFANDNFEDGHTSSNNSLISSSSSNSTSYFMLGTFLIISSIIWRISGVLYGFFLLLLWLTTNLSLFLDPIKGRFKLSFVNFSECLLIKDIDLSFHVRCLAENLSLDLLNWYFPARRNRCLNERLWRCRRVRRFLDLSFLCLLLIMFFDWGLDCFCELELLKMS